MRRALIAVVALLAFAGEARADELAFSDRAEIPAARPMREQLFDAFDELSDTIDEHLGILTNDVLALQFDGRHKRGSVRVRGGVTSILAFGLDSDLQWHHGGAHVTARLDLRLGDHAVRIHLPEFEVRPTSVDGDRGVEIRVPLIRGSF